MKIYEITLEGRVNSCFAYSNAIVNVKIKANYILEACQRAVTEFTGTMINIRVLKCQEIAV